MRLDQALAKIGVYVIKVENATPKGMTVYLRVNKRDGHAVRRWNQAATQFVKKVESSGRNSGTWDAEIAKVLYAAGGSVKFTWRVIFQGNIKTAQRLLGEAALDALKSGVEVTSVPLVGNRPEAIDVRGGKTKGAHDIRQSASIVASHFMPGGS